MQGRRVGAALAGRRAGVGSSRRPFPKKRLTHLRKELGGLVLGPRACESAVGWVGVGDYFSGYALLNFNFVRAMFM